MGGLRLPVSDFVRFFHPLLPPYTVYHLCAFRLKERMNRTLTQLISFEFRPPDPRSLLPDVSPLVSERQLWSRLCEHHLELPQHLHPGGACRSGMGNWKGVKVEIDGGSADGCERSG